MSRRTGRARRSVTTSNCSASPEGLRATSKAAGFCGLGSVKANIGHCGPAAGIAGFIKAVNVVRTGVLPPHPLVRRGLATQVCSPRARSSCRPSGTHTADADRHVLVNSMGVGGTNVAAVLAPPPAPARPSAPQREVLRLVLSARNRTELDTLSGRLADALDKGDASVADVAHTLRVGRTAFPERRVVVAAAGWPGGRVAPAPSARWSARSEAGHAVAVIVAAERTELRG